MKQLVILSGKGGTGKTSLAAAFAHLASKNRFADWIVLADADVDAANLELVLQPQLLEQENFRGGQVAVIDQDTCASCGDCLAVCRFDAINPPPRPLRAAHPKGCSQWEREEYWVDPIARDGCAACVYQCPTGSISMQEQVAGTFCVSDTRYGPLYDMKRILQTTEHLRLPTLVCINKADIYPLGSKLIKAYCWDSDFEIAGKIPYDETVTEAMVHGEPITEYRPDAPASWAIANVWHFVMRSLSIQTVPSSVQETE